MKYPKIIQGGMGMAVSNWVLAKAVSVKGQLGVVAGTALDIAMVVRLKLGDDGGDVRRALKAFPVKSIAEKILNKYFKISNEELCRDEILSVDMSQDKIDRIVAATFVEIFLAKEGHNGIVGINLLEKIQTPNLASIYGAILAGVDYIIMGAGIPREYPNIINQLVKHEKVSVPLNIAGATSEDNFKLTFDPSIYGLNDVPLNRPTFLAIISSNILATTLIKKSVVKPDGFIIELPCAGGHNAPPRGNYELNELGEPIYGEKDVVDIAKIAELGVPFWLAGGYGSSEGLQKALDLGAEGIQVGTAFAFCVESGMREDLKRYVLQNGVKVLTDPKASPTGYPFKIGQVEGTLSDSKVCEARKRICNLGYLRQPYRRENGQVGYRCSAEPINAYLAKGGNIEDTVGAKCLCNGLLSAIGYEYPRPDGYIEPAVLTVGDDATFFKNVEYGYKARDVVDCLLKNVNS